MSPKEMPVRNLFIPPDDISNDVSPVVPNELVTNVPSHPHHLPISDSPSDPIRHRLTASNAKKLALILVIAFIIYHCILHFNVIHNDSCKWLLSDGRFQGYHVWQPYGCMLHNYTRIDARLCMRYNAYFGSSNFILFIGDSRIRQIYHSLAKLIAIQSIDSTYGPSYAHHDLTFDSKDLNLEISFIWKPFLDNSFDQVFQKWHKVGPGQRKPKMIIAGCGTWSIKESNASSETLEAYHNNLTRLTSSMDPLAASGTQILWVLQDPVNADKLSPERSMISNEQIDAYNKVALEILRYTNVKIWSSARLLSQGYANDEEDGLHMASVPLQYAVQILLNMYCNDQMNFNDGTCCSDPESVTIIQVTTLSFFLVMICMSLSLMVYYKFFNRRYRSFNLLVNQDDLSIDGDGDEEGEYELMAQGTMVNNSFYSQVPGNHLLNGRHGQYSLVNSTDTNGTLGDVGHEESNLTTTGPSRPLFGGGETSPQSPSPPNLHGSQETSLSHRRREKKSIENKSYTELVNCLAKVGLIMIYAFLCDRTNFFMKENKYYTKPNFFLPITYVFALGLFFTDESASYKLLPRDQTDEWKGWMQLIILTYHMTGASQVLPIYVNMRLLVTMYLFLTGYGHFTYFWHKGDQGFKRLLEVLFRLNFLVVCLCLTMNRPYQFYYFVPLVTFWFVVVHITLITVPQVTIKSVDLNPVYYLYLVLKLLVLLSVVTVLYMSEVFFEKIFLTRPWKALFVTTDDSIKDWWFRWKIDRYSVPAGMIFAFVYEVMKKHKLIDDNARSDLFSRGIAILISIASFTGLSMYFVFSLLCRNKSECNEIHPYISFVPIVSYVMLRNLSGRLRSRYSSFFAWIGQISLELFILQYHIWLAADTHGILVLVPSYPVLNVLVTLFIFVCASHEMHSVTKKLVNYAISNDWRLMARNLLIFFLILIPIGIKDGMF